MPVIESSVKNGHWLLLGFSFGLTSDGSPGACNSEIATKMATDLKALRRAGRVVADLGVVRIESLRVGIQWEIYDALKDCSPGSPTDGFIVAPPFRPISLENPAGFVEELRQFANSKFPAPRRLAELMRDRLPDNSPDVSVIDGVLEGLWRDRQWGKNFVGLIDFEDLRRLDKGLLGIEKRRMPIAGDYGFTGQLREYQAMRVNRLIMETIMPLKVLPRAKYLNTQGVAEFVRDQSPVEFDGIIVYSHPQHFEWCSKNVNAVFHLPSAKGWDEGELWDSQSAQVWTRSSDNYRVYNSI